MCGQNKKQGLGFMLGKTVVDTQYLKVVAAQLITGGALVGAYLLALANPSAGQDQCALSAVQASTIQALQAERNSNCSMDMTVPSILN